MYPITARTSAKFVKKFTPGIAREYAKNVQDYVNNLAKDKPVTVINYYEIATALGISEKFVRELLSPIEAGHN